MKALAVFAIWGTLLCPIAWSAPCVSGSLATYQALGSGGCTIGNNLFSSFGTVPGTTGATEFSPSAVSITPSGGSGSPQLLFSVDGGAMAGQLFETIFTYQISGNHYLQSNITLANSSESGDGAVTDIQNLCAGGTFGSDGVTGCTGTPLSLLTVDGIQNTDQTALATPALLSVTDDFTIDGGTAGSAAGGTFTDQFQAQTTPTPTPEPSGMLPFGILILLIAALWRRRSTKQKHA
jgi:MYXO-CTERM domain-containing protein